MRTVRLHGWLGERFGREWHLAVATPGEAVRAIACQVRGFEQALIAYRPGFRVFAGPARLGEAEIAHPLPADQVIRIVPVIAGAIGDDFGGILLGAALIGLSFILPTAPLFTFGSFSPSLASLAFGFGANLILGGVINALTSSPAATDPGQRERPENRPSYVFDGAVNTTAQGNPVPILYGEMEVGSQVLSASITTEQLIAVATPVEPVVAPPEAASESQYADYSTAGYP